MNDEKHPNQVALEELRALLYRNSQRFCGGELFPVTQELTRPSASIWTGSRPNGGSRRPASGGGAADERSRPDAFRRGFPG